MKLQLFFTCCLCIFFINAASSQEAKSRMTDDVAALMAKGDKMSANRLAANINTTITRKYKMKTLKQPVIEAIGSLISFRRSQKLSRPLQAHLYDMNDQLIVGLISNTQSRPRGESRECLDAREWLKSEIKNLTQAIKAYMDCMARNSKRYHIPKSRNYNYGAAFFFKAPSPPPGETPLTGGFPPPCYQVLEELAEAKQQVEYMARLAQEFCE